MAWAPDRAIIALERFFTEPNLTALMGGNLAPLTLYGAVAVTAMLIFYALEARAPVFVLAFAAACVASSAYGFLQGAWPFGLVELVWSGVALRRWFQRRNQAG